MELLKALFPMKTTRRAGFMPVVHVALSKNYTRIENMVGHDDEQIIQDKIEDEFMKLQAAKKKR